MNHISIPARGKGDAHGTPSGTDGRRFLLFAMFWVATLILGSAGADYPLAGMLVQATSLILLIVLFLQTPQMSHTAPTDRISTALAASIVALPLLQLLPLPPALWRILPGRERAAEIYDQLGWQDAWLPLSLDPEATKAAALSLIPGLAAFFSVRMLTPEQRRKAAMLLVGAAVLGALLGAVQIATGGGFTPFDSVHRGHALGFFTNRNHQALFLLIAMPFACAAFPTERHRRRGATNPAWGPAGVILLLTAAVLATKSRSGAAFLLIVLPFCAMQLGLLKIRPRNAAIPVVIVGLLLAIVANSSAVQDLLARFGNADDDRASFWANTLVAIQQNGLLGTGFGSFPIMYRAVEPLADLSAGYVNHAHSDYLELLLDGGLAALALLLIMLAWIGSRAIGLMKSVDRSPDQKLAAPGLIGILLILLHSGVDYPLRMLSLEAVFGFLCALLIPARSATATEAARLSHLRWFAVLPALACLYAIIVGGLVTHAVATSSMPLAHALSNQSAAAASYAAKATLDKNPRKAASLAESALRQAPLDAQALSTLALAKEKHGDTLKAAALMNLAAGAGWWDDATQIWMFDRARDVSQYDIALERADALLRRDMLQDALFPMLLEMAAKPDAAAALVSQLEAQPGWRGNFLKWADRQGNSDQQRALDRIWAMLARSSAPPSPREAAIHVAGLIENHRFAQARQIWARATHTRPTTPFDGNFTAAAKPLQEGYVAPFQWNFSDEPAATNGIDQPPAPHSGVALNVTVDPGFSGMIARQMIVLPRGSYRLGYAMLPIENVYSEAVHWTVRCVNSNHTITAAPDPARKGTNGWTRMAFRFDIAPSCPAQWLELRGTGNALMSSELWFDGVAISRP